MSKHEKDLPERLQAAGATNFERRLLEAAGREQPSRELSERMAQGIGISMSGAGTTVGAGTKSGTAAAKAANSSSSLIPWVSGALVAVGVAVGALSSTRPITKISEPAAIAPPTLSVSGTSVPATSSLAGTPMATAGVATAADDAAPNVDEESPARPPAAQRGGRGAAAGELANQIALVDAARSALAAGSAQRALSIVREYQHDYPTGTFRPEVSAVKIEALVKMGRTAEARTLAERFVVAYGPGPLADRVARLAHIAEP